MPSLVGALDMLTLPRHSFGGWSAPTDFLPVEDLMGDDTEEDSLSQVRRVRKCASPTPRSTGVPAGSRARPRLERAAPPDGAMAARASDPEPGGPSGPRKGKGALG